MKGWTAIILTRVVVTLINALMVWCGCWLMQPLTPFVTVPNAIGAAILLWVAAAEFRSKVL